MASDSKAFQDKVVVVGIGEAPVCFGIVAHLLQQDARVVVPAQSSYHLQLLQHYLAGINTGKLITLLTDFPDYDKAVALIDTILEEYGPPAMFVFSFDYLSVSAHLSDTTMIQWERTVEETLAVYFICSHVAISAMKKEGKGMFVAISDTDCMAWQPNNALGSVLAAAQVQMARSFYEEVKNTGVRFYQLFINNLSTHACPHEVDSKAITPGMIGQYIHRLYNGEVQQPDNPFLFLLGRSYPAIHRFINSH